MIHENKKGELVIGYVSGMRFGKSERQAKELAKRAEGHSGVKIEVVPCGELVRLREVAKWAGALCGDLKAADEEPTHYCSWFELVKALKEIQNTKGK